MELLYCLYISAVLCKDMHGVRNQSPFSSTYQTMDEISLTAQLFLSLVKCIEIKMAMTQGHATNITSQFLCPSILLHLFRFSEQDFCAFLSSTQYNIQGGKVKEGAQSENHIRIINSKNHQLKTNIYNEFKSQERGLNKKKKYKTMFPT